MSVISGKIEDMKAMSWPLAMVVTAAITVIGLLGLFQRDVAAASAAIMTLLLALGFAELREIKTNTNGTNAKMMEELTEYRRASARNFQTALENPAIAPAPTSPPRPSSWSSMHPSTPEDLDTQQFPINPQ